MTASRWCAPALSPRPERGAGLRPLDLACRLPISRRRPACPASGILSPTDAGGARQAGDGLRREEDIIAHMERWRWLPRDLGASTTSWSTCRRYRVRVIRSGSGRHTRQASSSASLIRRRRSSRDTMQYVIVNPSWYVPPSILKKEFLPELAADPDYAAKRGYVVTYATTAA